MEYIPERKQQMILCCECGVTIAPNPANMCVNCIQLQVDVTEGIPKHLNLQFCRNCERYLQPPATWLYCELESRELLALCLKKLKGLSKVRLIDAGFIWTEPHSRRIKVSLTIQKEVFAATILQQKFEIEYTVGNMQCPDCTKIMAKNMWKATVQVRQKVEHQRTFLYLEQLIIKHNMHLETTNIKVVKGGLDFQYADRSKAIKMVDFLQTVVPVRTKSSEQLISHDIHTSISNYKFTYSVEIVPTCKDDLICMSKKMANSLGQVSPIVLCTRVGGVIKVLDFSNLKTADITSDVYWRGDEISTVLSSSSLKEFYVIDVEPVRSAKNMGKFALADITVQRLSDVGKNNKEFIVRSHLGNLLNYGDTVLGYDLEVSNINNKFFERLSSENVPTVVLVKKSYSEKKRKRKQRNWKLKQLNKDEGELTAKKQAQKKIDNDYELFLRDLEEDPELRQNINLYKSDVPVKSSNSMAIDGEHIASDDDGDEFDDGEELPEVPLEELLDGLALNDDFDQDVEMDEDL
ncbi:60S ribosomal export protein NMD3 [Smittium mucronatum]|uniref:60S ribosomal export protein NMD3 n=1 Tax=Smittium mucronatum TaxID=133383 RepID=A0A1R0GMH1_9FUNG|nr:60S ribosomal export protein NMD3 [Smittium mucronatum]